jgi:hypothetical protein
MVNFMLKDIRRRMSDRHEEFVAKLFGSRRTPGSGNQWAKPADGRTDANQEEFAFAWDCKATMAASISISLEMWDKIKVQSHNERPMIPIRFYLNDRLTEYVDLGVVDLNDISAMREKANAYPSL